MKSLIKVKIIEITKIEEADTVAHQTSLLNRTDNRASQFHGAAILKRRPDTSSVPGSKPFQRTLDRHKLTAT